MALVTALIIFVTGLLLGGLGIYVGARLITDTDDYTYAIGTAFIGAVVWAVVSILFGWIPGLGPILTLLAWIAIINRRYPGGWLNAALISIIAWGTVIIVLTILSAMGITSLEAIGVPS